MNANRLPLGLGCVLFLVWVALGGVALGQGKNKKPPNKKDGLPNTPAVKKAKEHLEKLQEAAKDARASVDAGESALKAAVAATKQAASDRDEIRKSARERHATKLGLSIAIENRDAAAAALKEAAEPVLVKIRAEAEHQELTSGLAAAQSQLDKLTGDNPDARATIADEIAGLRKKIRERETAAIEGDQSLKTLRDAEFKAEEQLAEIKAKVASAAANDEEVKAAEKAWQEADFEDNKARKDLKGRQAQLQVASAAVAQGQALLAQAVQNAPKPNPKPNPAKKKPR